MNYETIIDKYYPEDDDLRRLLLHHSRQVADRCRLVASRHPELQLDTVFLEEAAMLHDIGIRWCHAPSIFCMGNEPYIRHGLIGGELLRREGYERHARVCERHTGTGLTCQQILSQQLPLPPADYVPQTLEEQLVCYADKFYSKSRPDRVLTVEQAAQSLAKFGQEGVQKFLAWAQLFE
ncbi:MAG: HD domain-containing protein [Prevotella sp.]|nr:HD domain-containing protein [Prevotella sp.]